MLCIHVLDVFVGKGVIRVCNSLRIIWQQADSALQLENASLIRCSVLRKYIAIVTQL